MNKLLVIAFLGLVSTFNALAQGDMYENDRRYCASGRSGLDFNSCMQQLRRDRDRERYDRREYDRRGDDRRGDDRREYDRREYDRREQWAEPQPGYRQPVEPPKLSDMQQRALNNCALLAPRDQPRCRATVMSTVR